MEPTPPPLSILTWNIAYAYGQGSEGFSGYRKKTRIEFDDHLDVIAQTINQEKADIVLLQEVDFHSKRSHFTDQALYLSKKTNLPYSQAAVSWDMPYVPYPYWPPQRHFGRVKWGGAVLSRFPVLDHQTIHYAKPKQNAWWYNAFYPGRYAQLVKLKIQSDEFWVGNCHLEAFAQSNRMEQARQLAQTITNWNDPAPILAFGGDLNTVPPEARQKTNFADQPKEAYEGDQTIETLRNIKGFSEALSAEEYLKTEQQFFTFPAHEPNRRLDYLFLSDQVHIESKCFPEVKFASDHRPVGVKVAFPSNSA